MQETSGDSRQNLIAVFWLSLRDGSKKSRSLVMFASLTDGGLIPIRTCTRGVGWPAFEDFLSL